MSILLPPLVLGLHFCKSYYQRSAPGGSIFGCRLPSKWVNFRLSKPQVIFKQGETVMGDKGKKDKGKREQQKKAQRSPKEKRRLKEEKKKK